MFTTTQSWRTSDVDVRPTLGMTPGLPWTLKIDGQCDHNYHSRAHLTGNCEDACLGEIVFADDTCLIGDATEIQSAEQILEQIMDWKEKVHPGKTEGLRLQQPPRAPHDVRHEGEQEKVRHVGGILHEQGGPDADTRAKRTKAYIVRIYYPMFCTIMCAKDGHPGKLLWACWTLKQASGWIWLHVAVAFPVCASEHGCGYLRSTCC